MQTSNNEFNKKLFYSAMCTPEHYTGEYVERFSLAWRAIDNYDFIKAFETFKLLADLKDRESQLNTAVFHEGYDELEDLNKAYHLYKASADQGESRSIAYLAEKNMDEGKYSKAFELFSSILDSKHNSYYAYFGLALMYENGTGVEKDIYKAISMMKVAAEKEPSTLLNKGMSYMLLGFYYSMIGDEDGEINAHQKSVDLDIANSYRIYEFYSTRDVVKAAFWEAIATGKVTNKPSASTGGCFIATEVYQDYDAYEVLILRGFRDKKLLKTNFGRKFVSFYYKYSPRVAIFLRKNPALKIPVKYLFLEPIIRIIDVKK